MSQMSMIKLAQLANGNEKRMRKAMKGYCIAVLWEAFEDDLGMGEQAALAAVCDTFNIPYEQAVEMMALAVEMKIGEQQV